MSQVGVESSLHKFIFLCGPLYGGDIYLAIFYGLYFSHHCTLQITLCGSRSIMVPCAKRDLNLGPKGFTCI